MISNKKILTLFFFVNSSTKSQVITFISSFIVGLGDSSLNVQVI